MANYATGPRVKRIYRKCLHCGEDFPINGRSEKGSWRDKAKKFCDQECWVAWKRANGGPRSVPIGTLYAGGNTGYIVQKVAIGKWRLQHVVIMEEFIGRKLLRSELIHHRNGNKKDNRIENLQVMTRSEHQRIHDEAEKIGLLMMCEPQYVPSIEGMAC